MSESGGTFILCRAYRHPGGRLPVVLRPIAAALSLVLGGCGSEARRGTEPAPVTASADEAELLGLAASGAASGVRGRCILPATSPAADLPRVWANILFVDGGRGHLRPGDRRFDELRNGYFRAAPRRSARLLLPRRAGATRSRPAEGPGHGDCTEATTFSAPRFDGDLAFVPAVTRYRATWPAGELVQFWIFVRRDGSWGHLAYGHTTVGGRPVT